MGIFIFIIITVLLLAKNKISSKLSEVPKENASPDCTYTKSGRKIKKKRYLEESYQEDSNQETESSDEEVPDGVVKPPSNWFDQIHVDYCVVSGREF